MKKLLKHLLLISCIFALTYPSTMSFADVNVSRISGKDRYETSLKVTQKYLNKANENLAVLASGSDFRTALYGSYLSSALKIPFYVNPSNHLNSSILNDLNRLNVKKVFIMGGDNVLKENIENELLSKNIDSTRLQDHYDYDSCFDINSEVDKCIFTKFFPNRFRGDDVGVLVNDTDFPDLLSAVPFLSQTTREKATYLIGYNSLLLKSETELEYFKTPHTLIYIIGGFNSVPEDYATYDEQQNGLHLCENPFYDSNFYTGRISGEDRYKTAIEIAKAYKPTLNKNIDTIVLVDGTNYPDALSSGLVATLNNGAVLLTHPDKLNKNTKNYITSNNIKNVIIVGGENSVSKNIENELKSLK